MTLPPLRDILKADYISLAHAENMKKSNAADHTTNATLNGTVYMLPVDSKSRGFYGGTLFRYCWCPYQQFEYARSSPNMFITAF